MKLDDLDKKQLEKLSLEINNKLKIIYELELIEDLKKNEKIKRYSFIIYSDQDDFPSDLVGFSSERRGFIDDHIPEEIEDDYNELLSLISPAWECYSCTYEVEDVDKVRKLLIEIGLKEEQPQW